MRKATESLDNSSRKRFHKDLIMVRASPVGPNRKSKDLEIHNSYSCLKITCFIALNNIYVKTLKSELEEIVCGFIFFLVCRLFLSNDCLSLDKNIAGVLHHQFDHL